MQQLAPDLYRLDIPLADSPLREIRIFLVLGEKRHLLIDTAFNTDACEEALLQQLEQIGVSLDDTDVLLTHMHVDHSALACRLKRPSNKIFATAVDRAMVDGFQYPQHWTWITNSNIWTGVPEQYRLKPEDHIAYRKRAHCLFDIDTVAIGQIITIGKRRFEVIDLAGHTPGHIGLWEAKTGTLFCGDHILAHISPNITAWDLEHDYLGIFCDNLRKVKEMGVKQLYPAHRDAPADLNARIDELLEHHQIRLKDILRHLAENDSPMTAFQIAQLLQWSNKRPLLEMPAQQCWFACSETLSHLRYLQLRNEISCEIKDGVHYFTLKNQ